MKRAVALIALTLSLANYQAAVGQKVSPVVLPNPKLLRCASSDCFSLWSERASEPNAVFPQRLSVDMDQHCLYGLTALYEKSISLEELKAAIDERYGNWAVHGFEQSSLKVWRVESEKFAIQLRAADRKDEKSGFAEAGRKAVIYNCCWRKIRVRQSWEFVAAPGERHQSRSAKIAP